MPGPAAGSGSVAAALDFSHRGLMDLSSALLALDSTKEALLSLQHNKLTSLKGLRDHSAEAVDARSNRFVSLQEFAGAFPKLRWLDLGDNFVTGKALAVPSGLPPLAALSLTGNAVETFSLAGDLPLLQWLDLSRNPLRKMPDISPLGSLRILFLDECPELVAAALVSSEAVPAFRSSTLEVLSLRDCNLSSISSLLRATALPALSALDLGGNVLVSLEEIGRCLPHLVHLCVSHNRLGNSPRDNEGSRSSDWSAAVSTFSGARRAELTLPLLETLIVDRNELTTLDCLEGCRQLRRVYASHNRISRLPLNLSQLGTSLLVLDLSDNPIGLFASPADAAMQTPHAAGLRSLPRSGEESLRELASLKSLLSLRLRRCGISTLSAVLVDAVSSDNMPNLLELDLSGNPCTAGFYPEPTWAAARAGVSQEADKGPSQLFSSPPSIADAFELHLQTKEGESKLCSAASMKGLLSFYSPPDPHAPVSRWVRLNERNRADAMAENAAQSASDGSSAGSPRLRGMLARTQSLSSASGTTRAAIGERATASPLTHAEVEDSPLSVKRLLCSQYERPCLAEVERNWGLVDGAMSGNRQAHRATLILSCSPQLMCLDGILLSPQEITAAFELAGLGSSAPHERLAALFENLEAGGRVGLDVDEFQVPFTSESQSVGRVSPDAFDETPAAAALPSLPAAEPDRAPGTFVREPDRSPAVIVNRPLDAARAAEQSITANSPLSVSQSRRTSPDAVRARVEAVEAASFPAMMQGLDPMASSISWTASTPAEASGWAVPQPPSHARSTRSSRLRAAIGVAQAAEASGQAVSRRPRAQAALLAAGLLDGGLSSHPSDAGRSSKEVPVSAVTLASSASKKAPGDSSRPPKAATRGRQMPATSSTAVAHRQLDVPRLKAPATTISGASIPPAKPPVASGKRRGSTHSMASLGKSEVQGPPQNASQILAELAEEKRREAEAFKIFLKRQREAKRHKGPQSAPAVPGTESVPAPSSQQVSPETSDAPASLVPHIEEADNSSAGAEVGEMEEALSRDGGSERDSSVTSTQEASGGLASKAIASVENAEAAQPASATSVLRPHEELGARPTRRSLMAAPIDPASPPVEIFFKPRGREVVEEGSSSEPAAFPLPGHVVAGPFGAEAPIRSSPDSLTAPNWQSHNGLLDEILLDASTRRDLTRKDSEALSAAETGHVEDRPGPDVVNGAAETEHGEDRRRPDVVEKGHNGPGGSFDPLITPLPMGQLEIPVRPSSEPGPEAAIPSDSAEMVALATDLSDRVSSGSKLVEESINPVSDAVERTLIAPLPPSSPSAPTAEMQHGPESTFAGASARTSAVLAPDFSLLPVTIVGGKVVRPRGKAEPALLPAAGKPSIPTAEALEEISSADAAIGGATASGWPSPPLPLVHFTASEEARGALTESQSAFAFSSAYPRTPPAFPRPTEATMRSRKIPASHRAEAATMQQQSSSFELHASPLTWKLLGGGAQRHRHVCFPGPTSEAVARAKSSPAALTRTASDRLLTTGSSDMYSAPGHGSGQLASYPFHTTQHDHLWSLLHNHPPPNAPSDLPPWQVARQERKAREEDLERSEDAVAREQVGSPFFAGVEAIGALPSTPPLLPSFSPSFGIASLRASSVTPPSSAAGGSSRASGSQRPKAGAMHGRRSPVRPISASPLVDRRRASAIKAEFDAKRLAAKMMREQEAQTAPDAPAVGPATSSIDAADEAFASPPSVLPASFSAQKSGDSPAQPLSAPTGVKFHITPPPPSSGHPAVGRFPFAATKRSLGPRLETTARAASHTRIKETRHLLASPQAEWSPPLSPSAAHHRAASPRKHLSPRLPSPKKAFSRMTSGGVADLHRPRPTGDGGTRGSPARASFLRRVEASAKPSALPLAEWLRSRGAVRDAAPAAARSLSAQTGTRQVLEESEGPLLPHSLPSSAGVSPTAGTSAATPGWAPLPPSRSASLSSLSIPRALHARVPTGSVPSPPADDFDFNDSAKPAVIQQPESASKAATSAVPPLSSTAFAAVSSVLPSSSRRRLDIAAAKSRGSYPSWTLRSEAGPAAFSSDATRSQVVSAAAIASLPASLPSSFVSTTRLGLARSAGIWPTSAAVPSAVKAELPVPPQPSTSTELQHKLVGQRAADLAAVHLAAFEAAAAQKQAAEEAQRAAEHRQRQDFLQLQAEEFARLRGALEDSLLLNRQMQQENHFLLEEQRRHVAELSSISRSAPPPEPAPPQPAPFSNPARAVDSVPSSASPSPPSPAASPSPGPQPSGGGGDSSRARSPLTGASKLMDVTMSKAAFEKAASQKRAALQAEGRLPQPLTSRSRSGLDTTVRDTSRHGQASSAKASPSPPPVDRYCGVLASRTAISQLADGNMICPRAELANNLLPSTSRGSPPAAKAPRSRSPLGRRSLQLDSSPSTKRRQRSSSFAGAMPDVQIFLPGGTVLTPEDLKFEPGHAPSTTRPEQELPRRDTEATPQGSLSAVAAAPSPVPPSPVPPAPAPAATLDEGSHPFGTSADGCETASYGPPAVAINIVSQGAAEGKRRTSITVSSPTRGRSRANSVLSLNRPSTSPDADSGPALSNERSLAASPDASQAPPSISPQPTQATGDGLDVGGGEAVRAPLFTAPNITDASVTSTQSPAVESPKARLDPLAGLSPSDRAVAIFKKKQQWREGHPIQIRVDPQGNPIPVVDEDDYFYLDEESRRMTDALNHAVLVKAGLASAASPSSATASNSTAGVSSSPPPASSPMPATAPLSSPAAVSAVAPAPPSQSAPLTAPIAPVEQLPLPGLDLTSATLRQESLKAPPAAAVVSNSSMPGPVRDQRSLSFLDSVSQGASDPSRLPLMPAITLPIAPAGTMAGPVVKEMDYSSQVSSVLAPSSGNTMPSVIDPLVASRIRLARALATPGETIGPYDLNAHASGEMGIPRSPSYDSNTRVSIRPSPPRGASGSGVEDLDVAIDTEVPLSITVGPDGSISVAQAASSPEMVARLSLEESVAAQAKTLMPILLPPLPKTKEQILREERERVRLARSGRAWFGGGSRSSSSAGKRTAPATTDAKGRPLPGFTGPGGRQRGIGSNVRTAWGGVTVTGATSSPAGGDLFASAASVSSNVPLEATMRSSPTRAGSRTPRSRDGRSFGASTSSPRARTSGQKGSGDVPPPEPVAPQAHEQMQSGIGALVDASGGVSHGIFRSSLEDLSASIEGQREAMAKQRLREEKAFQAYSAGLVSAAAVPVGVISSPMVQRATILTAKDAESLRDGGGLPAVGGVGSVAPVAGHVAVRQGSTLDATLAAATGFVGGGGGGGSGGGPGDTIPPTASGPSAVGLPAPDVNFDASSTMALPARVRTRAMSPTCRACLTHVREQLHQHKKEVEAGRPKHPHKLAVSTFNKEAALTIAAAKERRNSYGGPDGVPSHPSPPKKSRITTDEANYSSLSASTSPQRSRSTSHRGSLDGEATRATEVMPDPSSAAKRQGGGSKRRDSYMNLVTGEGTILLDARQAHAEAQHVSRLSEAYGVTERALASALASGLPNQEEPALLAASSSSKKLSTTARGGLYAYSGIDGLPATKPWTPAGNTLAATTAARSGHAVSVKDRFLQEKELDGRNQLGLGAAQPGTTYRRDPLLHGLAASTLAGAQAAMLAHAADGLGAPTVHPPGYSVSVTPFSRAAGPSAGSTFMLHNGSAEDLEKTMLATGVLPGPRDETGPGGVKVPPSSAVDAAVVVAAPQEAVTKGLPYASASRAAYHFAKAVQAATGHAIATDQSGLPLSVALQTARRPAPPEPEPELTIKDVQRQLLTGTGLTLSRPVHLSRTAAAASLAPVASVLAAVGTSAILAAESLPADAGFSGLARAAAAAAANREEPVWEEQADALQLSSQVCPPIASQPAPPLSQPSTSERLPLPLPSRAALAARRSAEPQQIAATSSAVSATAKVDGILQEITESIGRLSGTR